MDKESKSFRMEKNKSKTNPAQEDLKDLKSAQDLTETEVKRIDLEVEADHPFRKTAQIRTKHFLLLKPIQIQNPRTETENLAFFSQYGLHL